MHICTLTHKYTYAYVKRIYTHIQYDLTTLFSLLIVGGK